MTVRLLLARHHPRIWKAQPIRADQLPVQNTNQTICPARSARPDQHGSSRTRDPVVRASTGDAARGASQERPGTIVAAGIGRKQRGSEIVVFTATSWTSRKDRTDAGVEISGHHSFPIQINCAGRAPAQL